MNPNWTDVLTAIGTCSAVVVSLYFSNKKDREIKKLNIYQNFKISREALKLIITIENTGNTPIIISEYGSLFEGNILEKINDYLKREYIPILIKPHYAEMLEYEYYFDDGFIKKNRGLDFSDFEINIKELSEYKLFKNTIFCAEDTCGNKYPKF